MSKAFNFTFVKDFYLTWANDFLIAMRRQTSSGDFPHLRALCNFSSCKSKTRIFVTKCHNKQIGRKPAHIFVHLLTLILTNTRKEAALISSPFRTSVCQSNYTFFSILCFKSDDNFAFRDLLVKLAKSTKLKELSTSAAFDRRFQVIMRIL